MNLFRIAGFIVVAMGLGMLVFGVGLFAYQGSSLSPFVNQAGKLSFALWLPTIALGFGLILVPSRLKSKKDNVTF